MNKVCLPIKNAWITLLNDKIVKGQSQKPKRCQLGFFPVIYKTIQSKGDKGIIPTV